MRAKQKKTRRRSGAATRSGKAKAAGPAVKTVVVVRGKSPVRVPAPPHAGTTRGRPRGSPARVAVTVPTTKSVAAADDLKAKLAKFLEAVAEAVSHKQALTEAGLSWGKDISPRLREHDSTFDADFSAAYKIACQTGEEFRLLQLREFAADKALIGWPEPVFQNGLLVGHVQRYSEKLHEIALRARDPAYATTRHEVTGRDGKDLAPSQVAVLLPPMPRDMAEFERMAAQVHDREAQTAPAKPADG